MIPGKERRSMNRWMRMLGAGVLAMGLAVGCVIADGGSPDEVSSIEEADDTTHELRRACGGIAGIPCEEGAICVDNPKDDCDPKRGGADCPGICIKKGGGVGGEKCGELICPKGTHGCNCACDNAACVPEGMVCLAVCM
jgi:hypothetical protein